LRSVKTAISVARAVMDYSRHTLLVGESAQQFAVEMGFTNGTLRTDYSDTQYANWRANNCQPNFRKNVLPNPSTSCGPYSALPRGKTMMADNFQELSTPQNHDTITMVVMDKNGRIASGGTTNGLSYKIHGRVGDTPIMGAGTFSDDTIGGCGATGDGDVMMRFLPCYRTVLNMASGMTPEEAAKDALYRIVEKQPTFSGAIIALNKKGEFGAAVYGYSSFSYNVMNQQFDKPTIFTVYPFKASSFSAAQSGISNPGWSGRTVAGITGIVASITLLIGFFVGYRIRSKKQPQSLLISE